MLTRNRASALASPLNSMEKKINKLDRLETRGSIYSTTNSTIPTAHMAATNLGVLPPLEAPARAWKRAWMIHRAVMPLLHWGDRCKPPDSSLSLMCLWWKALAATDPKSPAFDNSLTYDLLPTMTRILVGKKLRRFYPRLHHANVEIRTTFLDLTVTQIATKARAENKKVQLITLGGGYDARSIKFRERGLIDQAVELDLPTVVDAKTKIFNSQRLKRRRPSLSQDFLPDLYPVDLNNLEDVKTILTHIVASRSSEDWHTIFLFEGVMIYLNEGVPQGLLEVCRMVLNQGSGSLVFADRLERIPGGDYDIARSVLLEAGWRIVTWQPKPGLARHMGCAEPV
jgi:O-methyltransferase involved in polyketide biosynthesis